METLVRVYTLDKAAEALGISPWTLRDQVNRHEVPHHRRGRTRGVYFTEGDLQQILDAQYRPALPRSTSTRATGTKTARPGTPIPLTEVPAEFAALRRGK